MNNEFNNINNHIQHENIKPSTKPTSKNLKEYSSDIIFDFLRSSLSPTSGTEADVLIHCSDGQIPGQKLVLASISKMFYSIFKNDNWDEPITILLPDFSVHQMTQYFEDLYKCAGVQKYSQINEVLALGDDLIIIKPDPMKYLETVDHSDDLNKDFYDNGLSSDDNYPPVKQDSDQDIFEKAPGRKVKSKTVLKKAKVKSEKKVVKGAKGGRGKNMNEAKQYFETVAEVPGRTMCKLCQKQMNDQVKIMMMHIKIVHTELYMKLHAGKQDVLAPKMHSEYFQPVPTDPSKCVCSLCNTAISSPNILRHLRRKHKILKEGETMAEWLCSHCGNTFANKWSRDNHEATVHTKSFQYFCSVCNKGFTMKSQLSYHMMKHTGEKQYQCSECGIQFSSMFSLRNHVDKLCFKYSSNNDNTKLECNGCKAQFSDYKKLRQHILLSTTCPAALEVKPYECKDCGKFFNTEKRLSLHLRVHTGETPFQCTICFKKFKFNNRLKYHKCIPSLNVQ